MLVPLDHVLSQSSRFYIVRESVRVRLARTLTVLRSLAADGYDNCPSVRPCAGLIDLFRAGLGCALRVLIHLSQKHALIFWFLFCFWMCSLRRVMCLDK